MPKIKYHFNTKSLSLEEVRVSIKERLIKVVSFVSAGLVFSTVVMLIAYNFFNSPKEKKLLREIEQYNFQYKIMNDRVERLHSVLKDMQNRDDNIYRVIFEADPIPSEIRQAGTGGSNRYEKLEGFNNSEQIIETAKKLDLLSAQLYVQSKSYDELANLLKNKDQMMASIPAIQPLKNTKNRIGSGFGMRFHPILKVLRMHTGIDIIAPRGTPIYATGDGIVSHDDSGAGFGIVCVIDHGYGYQTLYAHMSKKLVNPGQKVKRGQIIGYVGSTGLSVAPHCHYEVHKNGRPVNPVNFFYNDLTPSEYEQLLKESSKITQSLS